MSDRAMYWYDANDVRQHAGRRVLDALRTYRASEMAMRRRTQESMGMGENDLLVLQFLMGAAKRGGEVSPVDIGRHLGVSTPSVTGILDRLERSGHLKRKPHPQDRRRLLVETTELAHIEVRRTLDGMHARMMAAVRPLDPDDADVIVGFLHAMTEAVDAVDSPGSVEASTA
ncbi:DNA-binding MarR family transcriptional regulator [Microbacterium sp. SORGH_AS428]|uniref:MarR family winged helix-turn-helix transcriptional regulator n=1 Tax=Microbacterium sp. SORGH_AS_0428 TaxID=3041788 RepID=UPI002855A663|nr:MarR family transcriptional regulator [Microbacterium sp. SORGH_AS_0428]MDR6200827.1 DNA-binding MarR family transcriptional regulator [Microbacterium sp. SORGH_AS_0428]